MQYYCVSNNNFSSIYSDRQFYHNEWLWISLPYAGEDRHVSYTPDGSLPSSLLLVPFYATASPSYLRLAPVPDRVETKGAPSVPSQPVVPTPPFPNFPPLCSLPIPEANFQPSLEPSSQPDPTSPSSPIITSRFPALVSLFQATIKRLQSHNKTYSFRLLQVPTRFDHLLQLSITLHLHLCQLLSQILHQSLTQILIEIIQQVEQVHDLLS